MGMQWRCISMPLHASARIALAGLLAVLFFDLQRDPARTAAVGREVGKGAADQVGHHRRQAAVLGLVLRGDLPDPLAAGHVLEIHPQAGERHRHVAHHRLRRPVARPPRPPGTPRPVVARSPVRAPVRAPRAVPGIRIDRLGHAHQPRRRVVVHTDQIARLPGRHLLEADAGQRRSQPLLISLPVELGRLLGAALEAVGARRVVLPAGLAERRDIGGHGAGAPRQQQRHQQRQRAPRPPQPGPPARCPLIADTACALPHGATSLFCLTETLRVSETTPALGNSPAPLGAAPARPRPDPLATMRTSAPCFACTRVAAPGRHFPNGLPKTGSLHAAHRHARYRLSQGLYPAAVRH
ncbi:hypothetical protein CBM2609_A70039 [Cupriavidus taiwanensis]|nr:hypothetical protein CBM2609_A70039 [Cupriavidus taiwanensis]SOZ46207.1 hypothetical protein CBM2610_A70475 [Cupriavidus taiwanensis]